MNIRILEEKDFEIGKIFHKEEKIDTINEENMFCAGIYCILTAVEIYQKQKKIYDKIIQNGLTTPKYIINNLQKLEEIIKVARFPNSKKDRIHKFALWWNKSDLPKKIIDDINNSRKEEFGLRNKIAEETPGMSYKAASLFMIKLGYENMIPIDIWMLRFLKDNGYDVKLSINNMTKRSPSKREYLEYEKILLDMVKRYNVSPTLFQCALWAKFSTWYNKDKSKQLEFRFEK